MALNVYLNMRMKKQFFFKDKVKNDKYCLIYIYFTYMYGVNDGSLSYIYMYI